MSAPTFALGIPHTPWVPERAASLERLFGQLGAKLVTRDTKSGFPQWLFDDHPLACAPYTFAERSPNHVWSEKMWRWAASTSATHFLTLQDDAIVAPDFWRILEAMVTARPDDIIGLEVVHDAAPALAKRGDRWMSTNDCLVGVGYVVPTPMLREFLAWRESSLVDDVFALDAKGSPRLTEDTCLALFCMATGRRIYHPLPTIIDHDVSLASTYGNDAHGHRRPPVRWDGAFYVDLDDAVAWRDVATHVGRFYPHSEALCRTFLREWTAEQHRYVLDEDRVARAATAKLALELRIEQAKDPNRPRVLVCTPVRDGVHPQHAASLLQVQYDERHELVRPYELLGAWSWSEDIVRVRSRFVRAFLETDATHLWFVDADVSFEPTVLRGMLACDRPVLLAPYPRRRGVNFPAVVANAEAIRAGHVSPEAVAYEYAIRPLLRDGQPLLEVDDASCAEIAGAGLGCALIKREVLEAMVEWYRPKPFDARKVAERFVLVCASRTKPNPTDDDKKRQGDDGFDLLVTLIRQVHEDAQRTPPLEFDDEVDGIKHPTLALFKLDVDGRELPSEDNAFCSRWRRMGGKVHLYLGPGAPVHHHGSMTYRGALDAFGLRRNA